MIYQRYLHREYKEMEECESNKVTEEQDVKDKLIMQKEIDNKIENSKKMM